MSRSEAKTERRKVWVNEYSDGLLLLAAKLSRKEAVKGRGCNARTVCFVESRPGDVVLSRESVAHLMAITEFYPVSSATLAEVRALLRGGR